MSTYVMSDVHGQYLSYMKMLKLIDFKDDDYLYVLGDVIDRGPDGISIIKDLMGRDNADMIIGNHEFMLLNAIEYLRAREEGKVAFKKSVDGMNPFELWTHPCNGGEGTCLDFHGMKLKEQNAIEEYLKGRFLIKRIELNGVTYHLSHSYSMGRPFGKELKLENTAHKTAERIVWESFFDKNCDTPLGDRPIAYLNDCYIVGHIFTQRLSCMDNRGRGKIFHSKNYRGLDIINIDCGMALNSRSSRLACLRLDDMEEFYISLLED